MGKFNLSIIKPNNHETNEFLPALYPTGPALVIGMVRETSY